MKYLKILATALFIVGYALTWLLSFLFLLHGNEAHAPMEWPIALFLSNVFTDVVACFPLGITAIWEGTPDP